ncbi:MAG TPA: hypothetical protein VNL14_04120 [Candidatus Acidoferrales bacterium]|nr:hypothetical protein [Candidatus Acidoferrales bacterium]
MLFQKGRKKTNTLSAGAKLKSSMTAPALLARTQLATKKISLARDPAVLGETQEACRYDGKPEHPFHRTMNTAARLITPQARSLSFLKSEELQRENVRNSVLVMSDLSLTSRGARRLSLQPVAGAVDSMRF